MYEILGHLPYMFLSEAKSNCFAFHSLFNAYAGLSLHMLQDTKKNNAKLLFGLL